MKKINLNIIIFLIIIIKISITTVFSQTYYVDDYGAVGDGVTDDRDAIQNAIWDLKATGGTLYFTSGKTYIISTGLNFYSFPETYDYLVTSTASNKATIKIQDGAPLNWNHWGFRLSESRNITIDNLIIDGNRDTRNPTIETSGTDVLFIDGASDGTRLKNMELINSPMDNLYIVVHENSGETQMTDFEMHNCILENGFRNNMSVISGENFKIIGCEFNNANGTDPQSGIDFEPNHNSTHGYKNIKVEGCKFKNNVRYGIELTYINQDAGHSIIKNNYFENNGILVGSPDNIIHNNIFAKQNHQHLHGAVTRDGIIYFHANGEGKNNEVYNNYFYDNPMPPGSHLVNFMYNSGGNNHLYDNYGYGNIVDGFVLNNTWAGTPAQIISNNIFINRKEMGYWTMDNSDIAANVITDLSYFHNNGILINSPVSIQGKVNEALDFTPDNKYIEIDTSNSLNIEMNITLSAWINWKGVNANETEQVIIGRGTDWHFGINNSGLLGFYSEHSSDTSFTAGWIQAGIADAIPQNEWKFVSFTYDGRYAKLYIDAEEVASEQANGVLGTALSHIYIGALDTTTYSFNGYIDEVKIYNYALNQREIGQDKGINYYVDFTSGNDANQGTSPATAWKTIDKVNNEMNNFVAGDSILFKRGETWNGERLYSSTHPSGNMNNPIVYSTYGNGAKPIINIHVEQSPTWTDEGNNTWSDTINTGSRFFKNNIEMLRNPLPDSIPLGTQGTEYYTELINGGNNLKLYIYSLTNPDSDTFHWSAFSTCLYFPNTSYIQLFDIDFRGGSSACVRIKDNSHWIINNCDIGYNSGYGVTIKNSSDIRVSHCQLNSNFIVDQSSLQPGGSGIDYTGCSDGVFVGKASQNIEIDNCFFKNWSHTSFGSNTDDSTNTINFIRFHNNELTSPDIIYGGRIAYSGYSEDGEYYDNYIHDISVQNQLGGSRNHFHHNIIDGVLDSPLKPEKIGVGIILYNYNVQIKDNTIENNVIANTDNEGILIYSVNSDYPGELSGNIIRNNIIYNCGLTINNVGIQFHEDSIGQNIFNNIMENNSVFSNTTTQTCRYQYNGTVSDVSTFNNQSINIKDNIAGAPMFVDAPNADYHLMNNSPCIDAGTDALSTKDYDGVPVPLLDAYDIGAYEYGIYWNGNISHYWNISGNWSNDQVPDANTRVTIPKPEFYKHYPKVYYDAQIKSLYIKQNAKIRINENVNFGVSD